MRYRRLGRTGLEVSELGYGAWGIGKSQWLGADDDESLRALHVAIDGGVNFIDTALAYGRGHSEQLVGQVVREGGATVHLATKVPPKNQQWPAPLQVLPWVLYVLAFACLAVALMMMPKVSTPIPEPSEGARA